MLSGPALFLEALRLVARERSLRGLALVPLGLSFVAVGGSVWAIVSRAAEIYGFVTGWMPVLEAASWFSWLWVGPVWLFLNLLGVGLFLLFAAATVLVAFLLASVLAAPVHEVLSRRVEQLETGNVVEAEQGVLAGGARSILEEGKRIGLFLALQGTILIVGSLVPPLAIVTTPLLAIIAIVFLPIEYASFVFDRRAVRFSARRRWVRDQAPSTLAFGATAFVALLVPGANLVAMPVFVTAGTLLALRKPPREVEAKKPRDTKIPAGLS